MEPIITAGAAFLVLAIIMLAQARAMAAQNTGVVVPTNAILVGGDPHVIYLTASAAITPGDNVEPVSTTRVKACDNSAEEFCGTADLNKENATGEAGGYAATTDFAAGDKVPVITGACMVRKVAEGTVSVGKVLRPGTTAGTSVLVDTTSTAKYAIGRALHSTTDGLGVVMRQW